MAHIMLDLETMGTCPNAAIVSIGAVRFDLKLGNLYDEFYCNVSLKSAVRGGGIIDPDTILWWLQQGEKAKKEIMSAESMHIEAALKAFSDWVRKKSIEGVWGNGSDFDNLILQNAYKRLNGEAPWSYKVNRCYRTIAALFPEMRRKQNTHHALEDARNQAHHLCEIWSQLGGLT